MRPPTKPRLQRTSYRSEESKFWCIRPTVPTEHIVIFFIFPILNERLAGRKFYHARDLSKAVKLELISILKEQLKRVFQNWPRRLEIAYRLGENTLKGCRSLKLIT